MHGRLVQQVRTLVGQAGGGEAGAGDSLAALLGAVTRAAAGLSLRQHEALVSAVFSAPLWGVPPPVRAGLLDLYANLAAANGEFIALGLEKLVGSLAPPPAPPAGPEAGPWSMAPADACVQREVVAGLERLLGLVPTAPGRLLGMLVGGLPHKLRDRHAHAAYLSALFALAEGPAGEGVREGVLDAVVDHLIALDVEIKWEDIVDQPGGDPPPPPPPPPHPHPHTDTSLNPRPPHHICAASRRWEVLCTRCTASGGYTQCMNSG